MHKPYLIISRDFNQKQKVKLYASHCDEAMEP